MKIRSMLYIVLLFAVMFTVAYITRPTVFDAKASEVVVQDYIQTYCGDHTWRLQIFADVDGRPTEFAVVLAPQETVEDKMNQLQKAFPDVYNAVQGFAYKRREVCLQ